MKMNQDLDEKLECTPGIEQAAGPAQIAEMYSMGRLNEFGISLKSNS